MQFTFNAAEVPPSQAFEPLPAAWYDAAISSIAQTPTKDNATTGNWYLKVEWSLLGEAGKNRKIWTNLNLQNSNPDAVRIAYEQLSAICHATGVLQMATTEQLYGIPHQIKLSLKPAADGYDAKNEVKGWRKPEPTAGQVSGAGFASGGFTQPPAQQQPQFPPQQQAPQFQQQQMQAPVGGFAQQPMQQQAQQMQQAAPVQQMQQAQGGMPWQASQQPQQQMQLQQPQIQQAADPAPPTGKAPWEQ